MPPLNHLAFISLWGTDCDHLIQGLRCGDGAALAQLSLNFRPHAGAPSDFLDLKPALGGSLRTIA